MACTVRPVRTRRDLRRFIGFPYQHYAGNLFWVPPLRVEQTEILNPKKNPFFEHGRMQLFLAVNADNAVVGRIASIYNGEHLRVHQDDAGFFGFFECEENYDTAAALLDAAAAWAKSQGLRTLRGPTNPTLNDSSGLLVDGFDRVPSVLMTYNYPYYEDYLTRWGFERVMKLWAYYIHRKHVKFDRLKRGADIVKRRNPGLSLRTLDMSRYEEDVRIVRDIYNDAWYNNWGFVPVTDAEFAHLAASMKQVVDPRICFFVLLNDEPVGFTISLPNINPALQRLPDGRLLPFGLAKLLLLTKFASINEIRMPLMGVRRQYQRRAFDVLPVLETIEKGPLYGYNACETSWILDSNHIQKNLLASIGTVVDKEYALLEATLD